MSMDAKATVKVGDFSRGDKKRVRVKVADHDFTPTARVTPVGILIAQSDELFLACVTSRRHQRLSGQCGRWPIAHALYASGVHRPDLHRLWADYSGGAVSLGHDRRLRGEHSPRRSAYPCVWHDLSPS